jgi:hypothetical protein
VRLSLVFSAILCAVSARVQMRAVPSLTLPGTVAAPLAAQSVGASAVVPELTPYNVPFAVQAPALPPSAVAPALTAAPAASVPFAPAPNPVAVPASVAHPREWKFSTWTPPAKEETPGWKFRDWPFLSARLFDGGRSVETLGAGAMGSVFVHPTRPHAVVKMARAGYKDAVCCMAPDDESILQYEDYDLDRLAALDAAPKTLARVQVSGQPGSVRERIYGRTVGSLRRRGAFGADERAMVHDLLRRIAEGGFVARDLNLGNIMIGRRAGDAQDRAWLVDALGVFVRDGLPAVRLAEMLAEPVPWLAWNGFGLSRPLSRMLDGR